MRAPEWTLRLDGSGHPHCNWLAFLDDDAGDAVRLVGELLIRWQTVCRSLGREASIQHGVGWDKVTLNEHGTTRTISEYLAKGAESWSAGAELMRSDVKRSRSELTFAPFDLLRWFDETGDMAAIYAWRAYERAQEGRAARTFPAALRKAVAAVQAGQAVPLTLDDVDQAEPDMAEGDAGTEQVDDIRPDTSVIVAEVEPHTWAYIRRHRLDDAIDSIIEAPDIDADEIPELLRRLLDVHGATVEICDGIRELSPNWGKRP